MVYEVISPRGRGTGNIVGVHTESPQCIDSLDMQKAMVAGGSKITFEGTEEEYEAVKDKLHPKTKHLLLLTRSKFDFLRERISCCCPNEIRKYF